MRVPRGRLLLSCIGLVVLSISILGLVPVPFEAVVRREEVVQLNASYMRCCLLLARRDIQSQLLHSSGLQSNVGSHQETPPPKKPAMGWLNLLATRKTDGYSTSEDFGVNCSTEIGDVSLDMRQETQWNSDRLAIATFSKTPGEKLVGYRHEMHLVPEGKGTSAKVSLEIQLRLGVPFLFWGVANSRLERSVNDQLQQFSTKLQSALVPSPAKSGPTK